jgi:hypothetical protein
MSANVYAELGCWLAKKAQQPTTPTPMPKMQKLRSGSFVSMMERLSAHKKALEGDPTQMKKQIYGVTTDNSDAVSDFYQSKR